MPTQKSAKTMAKSLRDALAGRNVSLSHSACLEIVARQFGFADWNTLSARLPAEEERRAHPHSPDHAPAMTVPAPASSHVTEHAPETTRSETEATLDVDATHPATGTPAPWSTCSFCGKSRPEVRIVFGGCGGWEGFRARRGLPERSNVFICNECVTFAAQILADAANAAKESHKV